MIPTVIASLLGVTPCGAADPTGEDQAPSAAFAAVTIDPADTHQTFEGFGYSGSWWSPHVGTWPDEIRGRILDLLYTDEGAHLAIYRYNPGAGISDEIEDPWRTAPSFEVAPGEYDWARDPGGIRILREVLDRGVTHIDFCFYSPPKRMTISGMPSGGPEGGPNLRTEDFGAYARYCVDIAEHWRDELGLDAITVSPINEPQWPWGRDNRLNEGMALPPAETAMLLRAVSDEIERRGVPLRLDGPDAGEWSRSTLGYVRAIAADEVLRERLHRLAIHSYWSEPEHRAELRDLLDELGFDIEIAQTEWCHMEWGHDASMESALVLAGTVHDDLELGDVVSWSGWLAVGPWAFKSGLIYIDRDERTMWETKRLWVMAQFSRFIRPGAVRVDCEVSDDRVRAVAFRAAEGDHVVCVLTNPTEAEIGVTLDGKASLIDAHRTDAVLDCEPVELDDRAIRLPAGSVTTLRLSLDSSESN